MELLPSAAPTRDDCSQRKADSDMPKMTFIERDGNRKDVEAPCGLSVLEIAHRLSLIHI